jgi:hypothetical protein
MSVVSYVGMPRHGKTYTAVKTVILPALRAGRTVVTNIPMKVDLVKAEIKTAQGATVDLRGFDIARALAEPDTILEDCPPGAVVVFDEVYKLFPAGLSVAKVPEAFKQILAEHGHRVDAHGDAMQIVFVCQDLAQISAFARQLVETTFRVSKLSSVGLDKRFRVDVFNGPVQGANPPVGARLREIFDKYDKSIYRYYISHTLSESGSEGANEAQIDRRSNLLWSWKTWAIPLALVLMVYFAVHHLTVQGKEMMAKAKPAPLGSAPAGTVPLGLSTLHQGQPVSSSTAGQGPPREFASQTRWFVKGWVKNDDDPSKSVVMFAQLGGGSRVLVRPFSKCLEAPGELLRCQLDGAWYSEVGPVAPVSESFSGPVAAYSAAGST